MSTPAAAPGSGGGSAKAGILCYSVAPTAPHSVFFLLGKETCDRDFHGRATWCEFGGKVERNETVEQSAAREFFEEGLALLCTEQCIDAAQRWPCVASAHDDEFVDRLAEQLRRGAYSYRLTMCVNHGAVNAVPRRYHTTFVVQVPWNPDVGPVFATLSAQLRELAELTRAAKDALLQVLVDRVRGAEAAGGLGAVDHDALWPLAPIPAAPRTFALYPTSVEVDVERGTWAATWCRLAFRPGMPPQQPADLLDRIRGGGAAASADAQWSTLECRGAISRPSEHRWVAAMQSMRDVMRRFLSLTPTVQRHVAVGIDAETGFLCVRREFLEKQQVQYWSVERLREMLANGGYHRKDFFRCAFLPTIAVALDLLRPAEEGAAAPLYTVYCNPRPAICSIRHGIGRAAPPPALQ